MFLQELFYHSGVNLVDEIIMKIEPFLIAKAHSEKTMIKQEAQKAYQILIENCLKDSTLIAVCISCQNKNSQISELSYKALERSLSLIGQNVTQVQPNTFKGIFSVIIVGLNGKRQEILKSCENIVKYLYQFLGDSNFSLLIDMLLSENVIQQNDLAKLKRVFEVKESKNKEHISEIMKQQRQSKVNEQFSNMCNYEQHSANAPKQVQNHYQIPSHSYQHQRFN